ncbi:MAG: hypothetical protein JNK67_08490 [Alphaproteobacteria bacterium]|nr:hypothetical protein [Alphaproteobacteria bacterium]
MRTIAMLAAAVLAALGAATGTQALEVRVEGLPTEVFRWSADRCETWHVPDAPARAFRTADGGVRLIAAHHRNRFMAGEQLRGARVDCAVAFHGGGADAPEAYDDKLWLSALWTDDGTTVHALAHAEFHGQTRPAHCPAAQYMACWRNQLVHVVSYDGGRHFERNGVALVAGLPYRFDGALGRRSGYFEPSNIVRGPGGLYAFLWAEAIGAQRRGACLMRTTDIADPEAWRAWDGGDFTVRFRDAYRDPIAEPARHVCAPIARLDGVVSGVVRHRPSGRYIAVYATVRAMPDGSRRGGVWATHSADLTAWSEPALLMELPLMWARDCAAPAAWAYPALLDPDSEARNFDEIGARADLYLTRFNLGADCKLTADRDLVRFGVAIRP